MSDKHTKFAEQLLLVRPTTRSLVTSILLDAWPNDAAAVDFGIDSQKHYESLYFPIRKGEITPKALDEALDDGQKLTALTREVASNPHKDVEFHTSWDLILGRDISRAAEKIGLEKLRSDSAKARVPDREMNLEHDRGDMDR
jgi:hypothetical protein